MNADDISREVDRQVEIIRLGCVDFYGEDELRQRLGGALREQRPLRVKLGMDPSSPDLHLGHTIVLTKLRLFQELGHTPVFLIGDFTARIGDPSGKKKTRPSLSAEQARRNATTYVAQVAKHLDVERAEVRFNSEWMDDMSSADLVALCGRYTLARLLERDDFSKRYQAGEPISVHELLYPFVQAYDSVALAADVELGGTDQTFNLLMAREIQRDYGQPPQTVLTHPLLVGLDGVEKMSKSLGNCIGVTDAEEDIYGRIMSISDALMLEYIDRLSAGEWDDLAPECEAVRSKRGDPMGLKQTLARRVVERLHGEEAAVRAAAHFSRVVRDRREPETIPEAELSASGTGGLGLLTALVQLGLVASTSEARRLVGQRAVAVDGALIDDASMRLSIGKCLIRVGKRRFVRLIVSP